MDVCCYIFEQAAFTSTGPEALYELLLSGGFDESHGKVIGMTWASEAPELIVKLKSQTLGYDSLRNIDYHLNMVMGQSTLTRLQEPSALIEFTIEKKCNNDYNQLKKLKSDTHWSLGDSTSGQQDFEKLCLEFSQEDLYLLFQQLDKIQQQLDSLS